MVAINTRKTYGKYRIVCALILIAVIITAAIVFLLRKEEQSEEIWVLTELLSTKGITSTSYNEALSYINEQVVLTESRLYISKEEYNDVTITKEDVTIQRFEFLYKQDAKILETKHNTVSIKEVGYYVGVPILDIITTNEGREYIYLHGWYYRTNRVEKKS